MRYRVLLLAILPMSSVAADTAMCPPLLQADAITIRPPTGWQAYSPSLMRLTGFGMMAGPPASMTYLVPAGEKKAKGRSIIVWHFPGGGEKWLYCTYDGSAAIQISKRLAEGTERCEVSVKAHGSVIEDFALQCR